ncbi:hypothetical protein L596_023372 [Steinernema carpocapsae]|uniref:CHK kinase-like domain-containing protein n=1 Tax=Steinernema carpocapsae TaxID=34508 RepID=A0A4U5MDI1_STECR|nr:hypothetical protein L596_023372 [Steinernema carpocapsae]
MEQIHASIDYVVKFQHSIFKLPPKLWQGKFDCLMMPLYTNVDFFNSFYETLKKMAPGVFDDDLDELAKFRTHMAFVHYTVKEVGADVGHPPMLCHGDFWNNNILWTKNSDGSLNNEIAAVVDWQAAHEGCLTTDVARLMAVSVDGEFRREHEDEILKYYFDSLVALMQTDKIEVTFTLEQVRKAYRANFIFESMLLLTAGPFLYGSKNEEKEEVNEKNEKSSESDQIALELILKEGNWCWKTFSNGSRSCQKRRLWMRRIEPGSLFDRYPKNLLLIKKSTFL